MVLPVPSRMVQSRREWFAPSRLIFPLRSLRIDRSRREWFRPSRIVIGDGLGAIDDSLGAISDGEARRRLRLGVRRLGLCFRKIKTDICYVFDLYSKPFSDEINFVSIGHLQRRLRDSSL